MKTKISKSEVQNKVNDFFKNIKSKSPKEIKKIKRLAANKKISLKEKRKLFCKYCLSPFSDLGKVRIKNGKKSVKCLECGKVSRWEIHN